MVRVFPCVDSSDALTLLLVADIVEEHAVYLLHLFHAIAVIQSLTIVQQVVRQQYHHEEYNEEYHRHSTCLRRSLHGAHIVAKRLVGRYFLI